MKKLRILAIIAASAFLMVLSTQTASAQKVSLNTSTGKKVINEKTIVCTFLIEGITSKADADKLAAKLAVQGIQKAEIQNYNANKADLVLTLPKSRGAHTIQDVFVAAGIKTVVVDGKEVNTSNFAETMKSTSKK
ncbi:MAG: hypothetical protein M3R27_14925 [Bacteroidota bacterium]|nr:hypothetical protein [Bacteroidota bacterium]